MAVPLAEDLSLEESARKRYEAQRAECLTRP
jgi:hypothetical protein